MKALENNFVFDTLNAISINERSCFCSKPYACINNKLIELTKLFFNVFIIWVNVSHSSFSSFQINFMVNNRYFFHGNC
jgi:hypothetical protein